VTAALLLAIAGLAALDSLNPATILTVALVLLSPVRRPVASALTFVSGAYVTVAALGIVLFLSAGAAADAVSGGLVWIRRIAFGIAAAMLLVAAVRRLRSRDRKAVGLPGWFSPWTAAPLGVLVTAADLPNAFPYVIAIERMLSADVPPSTGIPVILGYALVYCVPCLVLLAAGVALGPRVRRRLQPLYDRWGAATVVPASRRAALGLTALAVGAAAVATA
jgi:Sap, sulfolipid-1-addressing protein